MSFTSLGMSNGNFKNWVLFFIFYIRIGSHSRGSCPLLWEGLRHAVGGGTSNQEHGDLFRQWISMVPLQEWSAKREAFAIQGQFWQGTGGDLGSWWISVRASQKSPVGVLAGQQSLLQSARRDGLMAGKSISDDKALWLFLGTCIKMLTCHTFYVCSPGHCPPPHRSTPFKRYPQTHENSI